MWQSPRIVSWYHPRSSLVALFRQYFQYGYWKVRVIQKRRRPASFRHLVPVLFVLGLAIGWSTWLIDPALGLAYAVSLAVYAALNLAFSVRATASSSQWELLAILPLVFLVFHVGYGAGFAVGILDFVIMRHGAGPSMASRTRPSRGSELKADQVEDPL